MFIHKKPARPHALGEPILHERHKRPVTRRDFVAAGLLGAPAVVMAPAWGWLIPKCSCRNIRPQMTNAMTKRRLPSAKT